MAKFLSVLVVFLVISNAVNTNAVVDDVIEVLKLGKDVTVSLLEAWDFIEQTQGQDSEGGVEIPFRKTKQKKILNRIAQVSREISHFELEVNETEKKCESKERILGIEFAVLD